MLRALLPFLPALVLPLTACSGQPERPFPLEFVKVEEASGVRLLTEGEVVELHSGIQGGQHLFVTLRGEDVDEGPAQIELSLLDPGNGDRLTRVVDVHWSFARGPGGALLLENLLLTVDAPDKVVDKTVELEARVVSQEDWAEGLASQLVTVKWSPENP